MKISINIKVKKGEETKLKDSVIEHLKKKFPEAKVEVS